jgi:hypothetical protein
MNPNRPVSSLLLAQIQHLQHAERRLPLRYRTEIYTHAIRTEAEAARYIRDIFVTADLLTPALAQNRAQGNQCGQ